MDQPKEPTIDTKKITKHKKPLQGEAAVRKGRKKWWWAGGLSIVAYILWWGFSPIEGTILYGVCKTYVERHELYPQNLMFMGAEELGDIVRINYRSTNSFGMESFNYIECKFRKDEKLGLALDSVDINREKKYPRESKEAVEKFNIGIPAILKNPPNLAYPPRIPASIREYK